MVPKRVRLLNLLHLLGGVWPLYVICFAETDHDLPLDVLREKRYLTLVEDEDFNLGRLSDHTELRCWNLVLACCGLFFAFCRDGALSNEDSPTEVSPRAQVEERVELIEQSLAILEWLIIIVKDLETIATVTLSHIKCLF